MMSVEKMMDQYLEAQLKKINESLFRLREKGSTEIILDQGGADVMRDQLLKMVRSTRLSRALHNMKSGLMRSQFDKDLFDLRNSFRNNATVQDRLIDAEKRESSLKAEL
jgi:hypothetical protein